MRGRLFHLRDYAAFLRDWETSRNEDGTINEQELARDKEQLFDEQVRSVMLLAEASDYHRPLFLAFLRYFEIQNCRTLVAAAFGRDTLEQWYPVGRLALLGRGLLEERISPDILKERLEDTYLEEIFAAGLTYDRLQLQLDLLPVLLALRASEALEESDRSLFREMIAMRAALIAVLRRERLARHYGWDGGKIESDASFLHDVLGDDLLRYFGVMSKVFSMEEDALKKLAGKSPELDDIEYRLEQFYHSWVSHFFYRDFHSVCSVVSYLWLLSRQIYNLFGIVDGLRFGVSHEAILGRVISDP